MNDLVTANTNLIEAPLGKKSAYLDTYTPSLLYPIKRAVNREKLGLTDVNLPFYGGDIWYAYELSWINTKGKPCIAIARIVYPCTAPNLIESKSLKLYFNSFNNNVFKDLKEVENTVIRDLSKASSQDVNVKVYTLETFPKVSLSKMQGKCLDDLDITCDKYTPHPEYLTTEKDSTIVTEQLYSDLLKSNCLCTHQPDWATVQISYTGKKIKHAGLLKYIVSFRNINDFGEHCVERMYLDIMRKCSPEKLLVYASYTRRGGIDLNPFRCSEPMDPIHITRLIRQ